MAKKTVYIETSIVSYLTAKPSSDLLAAAWQKVTIDWWDTQRDRFDLFVSDIVIEEAGKGDDIAAARRLKALDEIPLLAVTNEVILFSEAIILAGAIPKKPLVILYILLCPPYMDLIISLRGITGILTTPKRNH